MSCVFQNDVSSLELPCFQLRFVLGCLRLELYQWSCSFCFRQRGRVLSLLVCSYVVLVGLLCLF
jgi:hypothetical protein